jgi:TRAP-type transport system small permease protein
MRAFLAAMTRYANYGSALFIGAMMLITVADVVMRAVFDLPITGTYDLVQLFLVGTVFLSIPDIFLYDKNIVIDFVDHAFGARAIGALRLLANIIAVAFVAVLLWRMIPPALDSAKFHEVSPDLSIPMDIYWALMIAGIVMTLPAALCVLIHSAKDLAHGRAER